VTLQESTQIAPYETTVQFETGSSAEGPMTPDDTADYKLASGEIVTISIDVGGTEISVTNSRGEKIGRIELPS
jgi:hypothetical protein